MRTPRAEALSVNTTIRLSPEEVARLRRAASANNQCMSDFVRDSISERIQQDEADEYRMAESETQS